MRCSALALTCHPLLGSGVKSPASISDLLMDYNNDSWCPEL